MSASYDLEVAVPGTEMPDVGDGSSFRRVFVPVRSPQVSAEALAAATRMLSGTTSGVLRLAHVRIYDPPMPRYPSRFYVETAAEAAALLDECLPIVLTRRRRPAISRIVLGSVADQVMREANCPVLAVHPNRK
jgi:hypothetical protein